MNEIKVSVTQRGARSKTAKKRGWYMVWADPVTNGRHERKCRDQSQRGAYAEAARLESKLNNPDSTLLQSAELTLEEAHADYVRKRLRGKTKEYAYQLSAGLDRVKIVAGRMGRSMIHEIDTAVISDAIEYLIDDLGSIATAKSYRGALRAFFRWCAVMEYCRPIKWEVCTVDGVVESKGRPLLGEEIERMLCKADKMFGERSGGFKNLMSAMHLSGMRLSEAMDLHSFDDRHHTILRHRSDPPKIRFVSTQKNRKAQVVICTPDFAKFLDTIEPDNCGFYFRPNRPRGSTYKRSRDVGRIVSDIGEACGIVTKRDSQGNVLKYATAHDFRRTFAARWAGKVRPTVLMHLMRHASINTTMQFYAGEMADISANEIWASELKHEAINQVLKDQNLM